MTLQKQVDEFNLYFTSANGVDVGERVTVKRDEWRKLYAKIQETFSTPDAYRWRFLAGNDKTWRHTAAMPGFCPLTVEAESLVVIGKVDATSVNSNF